MHAPDQMKVTTATCTMSCWSDQKNEKRAEMLYDKYTKVNMLYMTDTIVSYPNKTLVRLLERCSSSTPPFERCCQSVLPLFKKLLEFIVGFLMYGNLLSMPMWLCKAELNLLILISERSIAMHLSLHLTTCLSRHLTMASSAYGLSRIPELSAVRECVCKWIHVKCHVSVKEGTQCWLMMMLMCWLQVVDCSQCQQVIFSF